MSQVKRREVSDGARDERGISCPTEESLYELCNLKFGAIEKQGWAPRIRRRFGYFTPTECYEAMLLQLIDGSTEWLDVGCGRSLSSSDELGRVLSSRCRLLVGVDPDDNIDRNPFVHERVKSRLEEYRAGRRFDLITLRMVAEHIADPSATASALARLIRPGGRVVVYTVNKWSPVSVVAALTSLRVHHMVKRAMWGTDERDTFPTEYRMNTRRRLRETFARAGFREELFQYLDDCQTLSRWRALLVLELCFWRLLRVARLRYPEACLLGVYRYQEQ